MGGAVLDGEEVGAHDLDGTDDGVVAGEVAEVSRVQDEREGGGVVGEKERDSGEEGKQAVVVGGDPGYGRVLGSHGAGDGAQRVLDAVEGEAGVVLAARGFAHEAREQKKHLKIS